jgi:hypothetical protein
MKNTQIVACLVLALAACKSSNASSTSATPCATGAPELQKLLADANGIGKNLGDAKVEKEIEAAKAKLTGKRYAFKNCKMTLQGGERVAFAATKTADDIDCYMAGGEAGMKDFRHAAMALDPEKMTLDVSGTIAARGDRLEMTECKVTAHE